MKAAKHQFSFILFFLAFFFIGCAGNDDSTIRKAVSAELDPLKGLNSDAAYLYLSKSDLFSDADGSSAVSPSEEIKDVFSLFFKDFDYSIQSVNVSDESKTASASLHLTTIDAKSLAKDFAASSLREAIEAAAKNGAGETSMTIEERYLLLNHLLKTGEYGTVESDCTIELTDGPDGWTVNHTSKLENQLVGGLITYLSDSFILDPEETMNIYLNSIRKMSVSDLSNYLGVSELSASADEDMRKIYDAMVSQVHEHFNYKITNSSVNGNSANVDVVITTFDSDAVMEKYQAQMDEYLATPDALIDGADARLSHSRELLLDCLSENNATTETTVTFQMVNDSVSWKLRDSGTVLGNALFGSVTWE